MKKIMILTMAASALALAACGATTGSASNQSTQSSQGSMAKSGASSAPVMSVDQVASKLSIGMTKDQVLAAFGPTSDQEVTASGSMWRYAELRSGNGDTRTSQGTSRTDYNSGSSNRAIGRGLGTMLGGTLGRVARGAGDLAEGVTGRQSSRESQNQSSDSYGGGDTILRPSVAIFFDTSGRVNDFYVG